ncbi:type I-U CRISPR-associated protein Cas5/Cas6 [Gordonia sp. TBRC 11910]|uniref:Type I-U CRISPR-associated protein Cas5/Cas6 n=1 Tax=Gordonia asplenii TaxID=2725283 RepID=A0A848KUF0_9ACTN|nr:type I-U CRISPR-associated protein Csb2 [Gordonia asplenii]NMO01849.1 type I-U CRISPR-associated protein Cas5/Cas6 [Gordonia asplenii]
MSIVVRVTLLRATYHGLARDERVQWPPDPVRLLGALKSGVHALDGSPSSATAHSALNRLVEASPPTIRTPRHVRLEHPDTYTDRTGLPLRLSSKYEEQPARLLTLAPFGMDSSNRVTKRRDGVALAGHVLDFEIDVDMPPNEVSALDAAARHIPYFGRSEDAAMVEVQQQARETTDDDLVAWYPSDDPDGNSRGWQPNTLEWMDENYLRVFSDDPVVSSLPSLPPTGYVRPLTYSTDAPLAIQPAATALIVLPLRVSTDQYRTPRLLGRLHEHKLMPSGWKPLPLTASFHQNSDGRLVGLGFYPSDDADTTEPPAQWLPKLHEKLSGDQAQQRQLASLLPETWTGPARRWTSTTPLRGFPQLMILEDALRREAEQRFGLDVEIIEASTHARTRREHRWANSTYTDGFGLWWVTLEFTQPLTGPLQLGASTKHGFGAFLPKTQGGQS